MQEAATQLQQQRETQEAALNEALQQQERASAARFEAELAKQEAKHAEVGCLWENFRLDEHILIFLVPPRHFASWKNSIGTPLPRLLTAKNSGQKSCAARCLVRQIVIRM